MKLIWKVFLFFSCSKIVSVLAIGQQFNDIEALKQVVSNHVILIATFVIKIRCNQIYFQTNDSRHMWRMATSLGNAHKI